MHSTPSVEGHLGLVHRVARSQHAATGRRVDYDDLVSAGTLGLIAARQAFDPTRGLAFSTFAVPRIHGAMLDDLRRTVPGERYRMRRKRALVEARTTIERRTARPATSREIAAALDISIDRLLAWERDAESLELAEPGAVTAACSTDAPCALATLIADEARTALATAVRGLAPRERYVLVRYYVFDETLVTIGAALHVTESRVSQLRRRALAQLRKHLKRFAPD